MIPLKKGQQLASMVKQQIEAEKINEPQAQIKATNNAWSDDSTNLTILSILLFNQLLSSIFAEPKHETAGSSASFKIVGRNNKKSRQDHECEGWVNLSLIELLIRSHPLL